MSHDSLMLQFTDESHSRLAADTYEELGYEPHVHGEGRIHIHVRQEDLTSALEILQSLGGRIVDQTPAEERSIAEDAYCLDAIPIPAHTVNEDWVDNEAYGTAESVQAVDLEPFPADDAPYDRFDAR